MRIDYDYLKTEIFNKFLETERSSIYFLKELLTAFDDEDPETGLPGPRLEKFIFHWNLLIDENYVDKEGKGDVKNFILYGSGGSIVRHEGKVRLTKDGQDFAENLASAKSEHVEKVKGFGIGVANDVLKNLLTNYIINL